MTGIEVSVACKDLTADTLVGRSGARGEDQSRVGQRAVQEVMRKHQIGTEGRTPTTLEKWIMGSINVVTPTSLGGNVSDDKQSFNNNILAQQDVMSSTPHTVPGNVVADEDEDAEYELDEQQKRCWTGAPRRPPGPVERRGS
ncbi:hypothetical protein E4T44_09587 [Aureobasidium sp. EXF-8845]|nr:hypothetical protein E4T44_09587 [Aureobasidium sp. EXF-8845]KAI4836972.1 hypothetical protein E4T45_09836 [Aureobasidium sp. EXF-8846]